MHELPRVDLEPVRDLQQVVEAQVSPSALDLAEERPVDAALFRERFLAESECFAALTNSFAEDPRCERDGLRHLRETPPAAIVRVQSKYA